MTCDCFATTQRVRSQRRARGAKRALVISLDGLDARYLLRRDEFGLKIPTLRRLMREGAAAEGVVSVYPSVTYPAHATIVTGASPRRHGIYGNEVFEPPPAPQLPAKRWHWFAEDIRAETLWTAAKRRGLTSALVSWPVAAGAGDWNVPEIWKAGTNPGDSLVVTFAEISNHARPRGLVGEISRHDPEVLSRVTKDEGDDMRTRWAEYLIREKRPDVVLVHLFDLDHFQHDFGPFTPEAFAILEKSDAYVARLLDAARQAGTLDETAVFILSDHGFLPISREIRPYVILERAGLLKLREEKNADGSTRLVVADDWRALPYPTSGSCAVILRDPQDRDALRRARDAFRPYEQRTAETPDGRDGVLRVIDAAQLTRMGANPRAAFMLEGSRGYSFGGSLTGQPIAPINGRGTHGFLPTTRDYRASFVASGAGVTRRGSLGIVNMLDIAPTIARTLGLTLRDADGRPLKL
ncbi:MAG TPA: ectonucleotide pyrophosphatase/phosphodiesterase [Pyrinomonadaceae bacterium]